MKFFKARVLLWPALLLLVLLGGGAAAAFASGGLNALGLKSLFGSSSSERDSQVVQAVTRVQEVALLRLHIEGIDRHESNGEIFGVAIPASEKTTLLQYRFDAKLGVDGSKVKIERTGPESLRVTIPESKFIGFDNLVFEDALERGNPLSSLAEPAAQN